MIEPDRHRPADAALVRRVRWRLLAWSGGSTLIVLVALGWLLYGAVANSLASAATDQLRERAHSMANGILSGPKFTNLDPNVITSSADQPGLVFGGAVSGTVGIILNPDQEVVRVDKPITAIVDSVALKADMDAALTSGSEQTSNATVGGTQLRVLTVPVETPIGTAIVQVVGERTAEERTLGVLLNVLVLGGMIAMAASLGVGWLYADRALVPIRESMRRQREFAADASHELRTPLAIVKGSVGHLRRHQGSPVAEVGAALDDIEAGTDRLTALVDDLLLLARTDSGGVELDIGPADLGDIAIDATGSLSSLAAAHDVELHIDAEPVPMQADAARLRQLIVILVDNAIRHVASVGSRRVVITVAATDDRATLTVDDDGPGIRAEDQERIFDRFWRAADAPAGGTGLGLAIASWIVERHGGSISAANRPEGGARFEVRLPRRGALSELAIRS
jgi:two-component system sensor histidine kinase CiaH